MFMNQWDVDDARRTFSSAGDLDTPNLEHAAETLFALMVWANNNSDGWHSWPKPSRASKSLQEVLTAKMRERYSEDPTDITYAELRRILSPVKSFLTRQGVPHDEVIR